MIRTAIFSGSFNPVHIGHLALANWICEFENLDELWFLVTPQNPLKKQNELMPDEFRLELVRKSIGDYPKFRTCDFEFHLPRPSYTIDTLHALSKDYPEREFIFIMGADNWSAIERWKEYDTLLKEYPVLVYPRPGYTIRTSDLYPTVRLVEAPVIEISSTFIRDSYRQGKDIRFFLPEAIRHLPLEFPNP